MKQFFSANLRRMVMLAVFLSILPSFLLLLLSGVERYTEIENDLLRRGKRAVLTMCQRQELITENVNALLLSLRNASALKNFSPEDNSRTFVRLLLEYPLLDNIFIVSPGGKVLSSGRSLADSPELTGITSLNALDVRVEFASPFTGRPVIRYMLPLSDGPGEPFAYIGAEVPLRFLDTVFAGNPLPPGATAYLFDAQGNLVLCSDPEILTKIKPLSGSLWQAVQAMKTNLGSTSYQDQDGSRHYIGSGRIQLPGENEPYLYAAVSMPEQLAMILPRSFIYRDTVLVTVAALIALCAGLAVCHIGFMRPVKKLLSFTDRLSKGEFGVRLDKEAGLSGEFAVLGEEFNMMAESLERHNEEIVSAKEVAMASSRAKSDFLANMSHEIRTPMSAIIGMAHLIKKTELHPSQSLQVEKIHEAANDLLLLINNILDYSKIEAGKMVQETVPFHMGRLLNAVRGSGAKAAAEKGVRLVSKIPSETPAQLIGDPTRFAQALSILLTEAIERSPGNPVELSCNTKVLEERFVLLTFTLTIKNHVPDQDTLDDINTALTDQFNENTPLQTDKLKLMLAGSILHLLGGKACVTRNGQDCTFMGGARFTIPETYLEDLVLRFDAERVLLIGANPFARTSFRQLLESYNLRVDESPDMEKGFELLSKADRNNNPFAIVIFDFPEGQKEPAKFLANFRRDLFLEHLPLFILSTAQDISSCEDVLATSGIDAFLPRPVNDSLVVDTLSGLLRSKIDLEDLERKRKEITPEQIRLEGLRVLLVEDNAINREIASEVLQGAGVSVLEAHDGRQAVDMVRERKHEFDLILMDIEMPVMDGKTATRVIREELLVSPFVLPIIAMTAHNSIDEVASCLDAGMNDHTTKPIMVSQLLMTLHRWLPPTCLEDPKIHPQLVRLRDLLILSHSRDPEVSMIIEGLAPLLHEGRSDALRSFLYSHNTNKIVEYLESLLEAHSPTFATHG